MEKKDKGMFDLNHKTFEYSVVICFNSYATQDEITAVAFYPSAPAIAVGETSGKIHLWYVLGIPKDQKPVQSMFHWHAHGVNAISFTVDGVYMLSGGEEGVLVIWQLETRTRQFLPHLGSDIQYICTSPDQLTYMLRLKDNSLRLVSAVNLSIKHSINGLKAVNVNQKTYPFATGLVTDPRSKTIVMNGYPGAIQFYDHSTDSSVREVEVTPRNRVSRTEDRESVRPHVTHVSFSSNSYWMATIDERLDAYFGDERYLHFWKWNAEQQVFTPHTRMDNPHKSKITSLNFCKTADGDVLAVTCSLDGTFKIWEVVHHPHKDEEIWRCRSRGSYKGLAAHAAEFATDGSLLAVTFDKVITLWDPLTLTLERTLFYNLSSSPLSHLSFTHDSLYLITASETHVYVWNMLTCTVWWSLPIRVGWIKKDPFSRQFMVFTASNKSGRQRRFFKIGGLLQLY